MRYGEARGLESRDVQTGDGASGTYTVGWILGNVVYDLVLEYAPCCHTSSQRAPRQHARVGGATMASNAEANIAKALELKAQGNEAFKAADYKQAMVHYHQVRPARAGAHHTPTRHSFPCARGRASTLAAPPHEQPAARCSMRATGSSAGSSPPQTAWPPHAAAHTHGCACVLRGADLHVRARLLRGEQRGRRAVDARPDHQAGEPRD